MTEVPLFPSGGEGAFVSFPIHHNIGTRRLPAFREARMGGSPISFKGGSLKWEHPEA